MNISTITPGTSCGSTAAPGGTSQTDPTCRVACSPSSGIASAPTPLSGLENLPTPTRNQEAHAIIPNALRMPATEQIERPRLGQAQRQAVSITRSVVSSGRNIHPFRHADMTRLVFATGRLLELYMWNTQPVMSASDLEMVNYATRRIAKALAEGPHWQIIEKYWNAATQQNIIWSIAFEARTKEILKVVC